MNLMPPASFVDEQLRQSGGERSVGDHYALKRPSSAGVRSKLLLNRRFYKAIRSGRVGVPWRVLEIGPGHGFFADLCREAGDSYEGIESNEILYRWLIEKGHAVNLGASPPLPYKSNEYDLVYAGYVLEYLKDAASAAALVRECSRVLKPGGLLGIVSSDYMRMGREFWNVSYLTSFVTTERRVRQLMYDAGFEHDSTVLFAGNLFGPWRHMAEAFYRVYQPQFWARMFGAGDKLDSRWYKLRVTFPEGLLVVGQKPVEG